MGVVRGGFGRGGSGGRVTCWKLEMRGREGFHMLGWGAEFLFWVSAFFFLRIPHELRMRFPPLPS